MRQPREHERRRAEESGRLLDALAINDEVILRPDHEGRGAVREPARAACSVGLLGGRIAGKVGHVERDTPARGNALDADAALRRVEGVAWPRFPAAHESAWKRAMYPRSSTSGSASSKKSVRASSGEVAADLAASPRVMTKAFRSERRRKRSVIGPLPEGGTEQRSTAPPAGWPASRYFSTVEPPNEWPTKIGAGVSGSRARTKEWRSSTCSVILTAF